ncbi:uncharacterized protein Tco025E_03273 [Trypanosoma conorhini]|uniref:Uncharacterized protein n=1 Tax=Trypanosoma conorhini TaxID=83891 RepID=A0A3R7LWS0_9TRYP|nr:uncharacterized protein Tco025E_03273 [Trypanosoma conorhini]RNF22111.1 hypothetical protein Tco025E_03273 [Trypanosoma conorhini]
MSSPFGGLKEEAAPGLALLRAQLQSMRSVEPHTAAAVPYQMLLRGVPELRSAGGTAAGFPPCPAVSGALSPPQEKWDANVGMLRQLESRLRRYQESGVERRGKLLLAMEQVHTDMEQVQACTVQFQVDGEDHLQALRRLLAGNKDTAQCILRRPEAVMKEAASVFGEETGSSASTREEDGRLISRVEDMRRAQGVMRRRLENASGLEAAPSSASAAAVVGRIKAELQKERDAADARLSALKESFVAIVQKTLDELELLRSERVETEALCARILSCHAA